MKPTLLAVLLCLVFNGRALGADSAFIEKTVQETIAPLVSQDLPLKKRYVGIWVAVVTADGEYNKGFGEIRLGSGQAPDAANFFEIGSITKTFTGTLLAMSGIDINQKAQDFLPPEMKLPTFYGAPIHIVDLATHTSGLPRIVPVSSLEEFLNQSPNSVSRFLSQYQLPRSPRAEYDYSNLGMGLLAYLVEGHHSDDQTLRFERLCKRVTEPLEMTETQVFLTENQKSRLVEAYDDEGNPHAHWNWGPNSIYAGAGALKSTGADMIKYLKAEMGLRHSSLDSAIQKSHAELFQANKQMSLGYAWHIVNTQNAGKVIWHNGGTGGFQTFLGFFKEKKLGVIILANTAHMAQVELPKPHLESDPRIDLAGFGILKKLTSAP